MGRLVESLGKAKGHEVVVEVHAADEDLSAAKLSRRLSKADAVIDFSVAAVVRRNVAACVQAGVPIVEGTTGWNAESEEIESIVLEGGGSMVFGANFSIGVNLFYRIADFAAELISLFPEYEVFIEEQHHSRKKDAPSGTALKLKETVARHITNGFGVASTRAGNIPGTHRVGFDGPADQILLEHAARSREGFASGALLAAEWIVGKKGFYEFRDVVSEICQNREQ